MNVFMHSEIDRDLQNLLKGVPETSFVYHLTRLKLLIARRVRNKVLVNEMLTEINLAYEDLSREIQEWKAINERAAQFISNLSH